MLILVSCGTKKTSINKPVAIFKKEYNFYKIDSINSYYLIYLKRNDSLFKIISKKRVLQKCNQLVLQSNYYLQLQSINVYGQRVGNLKTQGVNYLDGRSRCKKFDDSTEICMERYVHDLYVTEDLVGKCYNPR